MIVLQVRPDGSRYIARRPTRTFLLRQRERQIAAERTGELTTEDEDAASEVVAALARRSAPPGQAPPAVSLLELSPAYAAVFARLVGDREAIQ